MADRQALAGTMVPRAALEGCRELIDQLEANILKLTDRYSDYDSLRLRLDRAEAESAAYRKALEHLYLSTRPLSGNDLYDRIRDVLNKQPHEIGREFLEQFRALHDAWDKESAEVTRLRAALLHLTDAREIERTLSLCDEYGCADQMAHYARAVLAEKD